MPLEIFCCYAREDQALLKQLRSHLMPFQRQKIITLWADLEINAGAEWEAEIKEHLEKATVILLLISPAFMTSDYCYSKEMMRALERQKKGEARVVPVILRPVYWEGLLGQLQALPENGKPVTLWPNQDEAFFNIAEGIYKLVTALTKNDAKISYKSTQHLTMNNAKNKQRSKTARKISVGVIALTISILVISLVMMPSGNAWQDYKAATRTTPTINDPLKDNSQGNEWIEEATESDTILFKENAYHIRAIQQGSYAYGCESKLSVDSVAFQVSMIMIPSVGSGKAGLVLGCSSNLEYIFSLDPDQNYEVNQIDSRPSLTRLAGGKSPLIHGGYGASNLLEVLKKKGMLELFINNSYLTTLSIVDTSGYVGFAVRDDNGPFEAMFQNFQLWI